jgi:hypothetical protein
MTRDMATVLVSIVLILIATAITGWIANDALARGRRWIVWGVVTSFFGLFALVAWLVRRRRSPVVRERLAFRRAAPIYAAAFCLVLLRDGRPSEQHLRQPPLGLRPCQIHHRKSLAALVSVLGNADL